MSRLPDYCECSLPNSDKHCRIPCGKMHHPDNKRILDWDMPFEWSDLKPFKAAFPDEEYRELYLGEWFPDENEGES